jgi:hypothetical protein
MPRIGSRSGGNRFEISSTLVYFITRHGTSASTVIGKRFGESIFIIAIYIMPVFSSCAYGFRGCFGCSVSSSVAIF